MEAPTPQSRPLLQKLFISPDELSLRAGWRLLGQTLLMLLIQKIYFIDQGTKFFAKLNQRRNFCGFFILLENLAKT